MYKQILKISALTLLTTNLQAASPQQQYQPQPGYGQPGHPGYGHQPGAQPSPYATTQGGMAQTHASGQQGWDQTRSGLNQTATGMQLGVAQTAVGVQQGAAQTVAGAQQGVQQSVTGVERAAIGVYDSAAQKARDLANTAQRKIATGIKSVGCQGIPRTAFYGIKSATITPSASPLEQSRAVQFLVDKANYTIQTVLDCAPVPAKISYVMSEICDGLSNPFYFLILQSMLNGTPVPQQLPGAAPGTLNPIAGQVYRSVPLETHMFNHPYPPPPNVADPLQTRGYAKQTFVNTMVNPARASMFGRNYPGCDLARSF